MWALVFLLAISACFAPPAHAGPTAKRLLAVIGSSGSIPFTINGNSSISSAGTADTGTESITTGAGDITVVASCVAGSGNQSGVSLVVDGVSTDLICNSGETKTNQTLTKAVTAAAHNVQVVGSYDNIATDSFSASNFRKP
jgi:hypothetical protein